MLACDADVPDPFLLRADGRWWCFATGTAGLDLQVLGASSPTGPWQLLGDPLAALPGWARRGRTWSPSVLATAAGYVLYAAVQEASSGRQVLATFRSDRPGGPYDPVGPPLVRQLGRGGAIDPDPFTHADGTATLLWKSDDNAVGGRSALWARALRPDGLGFARRLGRPRRLLSAGTGWEEPLIEAPCALTDDDGGHHLLYSAGAWESGAYAIGWATAPELSGPWTRRSVAGPWFAGDATVAGPGGQSVAADADGRRWLAYHGWEPDRVGYRSGGRRALHVDVLRLGRSGPGIMRP